MHRAKTIVAKCSSSLSVFLKYYPALDADKKWDIDTVVVDMPRSDGREWLDFNLGPLIPSLRRLEIHHRDPSSLSVGTAPFWGMAECRELVITSSDHSVCLDSAALSALPS